MLARTILLSLLLVLAGSAGAVEEVKTIIHTDHLGSPILGRSMDGETVWERYYGPYGALEQTPDDSVSPGYTGHLEERETGLVYAGARWYDPRIGRFLSPDPVGFSVSNPVSFNRYAYANNNPLVYTDPDGRLAFTATLLIGAGAFLIMENANAPDVGQEPTKYSTAGVAPGTTLIAAGALVPAATVYLGTEGTLAGLSRFQAATVLKSAQAAYKGTTRVGHALSKHAGRKPDLWGKTRGAQAEWNAQAMSHLRAVFRGKGKFKKVTTDKGQVFYEKRLPDGRGVRLNRDYTFKSFVD